MDISDISLEMELNGVSDEEIANIIAACKKRGFDAAIIDEELQLRGYDAMFSVDYEAYDDWEDGEYTSVEKIRHKEHHYD